MKMLRDIVLFVGFLIIGIAIGKSLETNDSPPHIDWMCGTITNGTSEPIKISIENEVFFDLRQYPGLICCKATIGEEDN